MNGWAINLMFHVSECKWCIADRQTILSLTWRGSRIKVKKTNLCDKERRLCSFCCLEFRILKIVLTKWGDNTWNKKTIYEARWSYTWVSAVNRDESDQSDQLLWTISSWYIIMEFFYEGCSWLLRYPASLIGNWNKSYGTMCKRARQKGSRFKPTRICQIRELRWTLLCLYVWHGKTSSPLPMSTNHLICW